MSKKKKYVELPKGESKKEVNAESKKDEKEEEKMIKINMGKVKGVAKKIGKGIAVAGVAIGAFLVGKGMGASETGGVEENTETPSEAPSLEEAPTPPAEDFPTEE